VKKKLLAALVSGVVTAGALGPFPFYFLTIIGCGILFVLIISENFKNKILISGVFSLSYFFLALYWVTGFSWPGYIVLVIFESLFIIVPIGVVPTKKMHPAGSAFVLSATMSIFEFLRDNYPFGGFPMASLALSQAYSPIRYASRLSGTFLTYYVTLLFSFGLFLLLKTSLRKIFSVTTILPIATAAFLIVISSFFSPVDLNKSIKAAAIQGGGPRGLRAVLSNEVNQVFERQVTQTLKLKGAPFSLILWPEDVIALNYPLKYSDQNKIVANLAKKFRSTLIAGVTISLTNNRFLNQAVAWAPNGSIIATFEKVHRVPFGEYVPFRSFFAHFGNVSLVPADAVPGTGNGFIKTPAGPVGIMISYEVFFDSRARSSVDAGALFLVVPTNTASYSNFQVPDEELEADIFRSTETGRELMQSSTVGYSDVISANGAVLKKSSLGNPAIVTSELYLSNYMTPYDKYGLLIFWIITLFSILSGLISSIINKRKSIA
jgi:apolipoprotein N-acyltransferase